MATDLAERELPIQRTMTPLRAVAVPESGISSTSLKPSLETTTMSEAAAGSAARAEEARAAMAQKTKAPWRVEFISTPSS